MPAYWSGTDTDTMHEFANGGGAGGWCVATVFNKKSESRSAVCMNASFQEKICVLNDNIPMQVMTYFPQATFDAWDAEYTKNCTQVAVHDYRAERGEWNPETKIWEGPKEKLMKWSSPYYDLVGFNSALMKAPTETEIDQGYEIRWNFIRKEYVKIAVLPNGELLETEFAPTFDIPTEYYAKGSKRPWAQQPSGVPIPILSHRHPMISGGKAPSAPLMLPKVLPLSRQKELKALITGRTINDILCMEQVGELTEEDIDFIWELPGLTALWSEPGDPVYEGEAIQ